MYQPAHHREDRLDVQHALIQSHPFGLLISSGIDGLLANAIPLILQPTLGSLGALEAHMAGANDQWRDIDGQHVLVVFQGHSGATPSMASRMSAFGPKRKFKLEHYPKGMHAINPIDNLFLSVHVPALF